MHVEILCTQVHTHTHSLSPLSLAPNLPIFLSTYLHTFLSIDPPVCPSLHQCIYAANLCIYASMHLYIHIYIYTSLSLSLSVRVSIYPSNPSVHNLFICSPSIPSLSLSPSNCLPSCFCNYLSIRVSVFLSVCLSGCPSICLAIYPSLYLSVCLSICLSSICLPVYVLCVYLSIYPSIQLCI